MDADQTVVALVEKAQHGDQDAWDQIVERYAPLLWSTCTRFRLFGADAEDVAATVWLRLVENLRSLRQPAALPGWLAATTRNECLRVLRDTKRNVPADGEQLPDQVILPSDEWLLSQERHVALRTAFAGLSQRCQALLGRLFREPPMPYSDISEELHIRVGSIGPTRQRCLDALRAHPSMVALGEGPDDSPGNRAR